MIQTRSLSVCVRSSVSVYVRLSACLSVYLPVCMFVRLSASLCVCLTCLSDLSAWIYVSLVCHLTEERNEGERKKQGDTREDLSRRAQIIHKEQRSIGLRE